MRTYSYNFVAYCIECILLLVVIVAYGTEYKSQSFFFVIFFFMRRVGKMCNPHPNPRWNDSLGKHIKQQNIYIKDIETLRFKPN